MSIHRRCVRYLPVLVLAGLCSCASTPRPGLPIEIKSAQYEAQDSVVRAPPDCASIYVHSNAGRGSGRALLAYSVGTNGSAENVATIDADGADVALAAFQCLELTRFAIPDSGKTLSGIAPRFRMAFYFQITGQPAVPHFAEKVRSVVVTTNSSWH